MEEISEKRLNLGIWWVTHRHQLKKWWVMLLAGFDILFFLYLLFQVILILFTWNKFTSIPYQMSISLIDFPSYHQANAPKNIQVVSTKAIAIPGKPKSFHLLANIKNPNPKWAVSNLSYHFTLDGKALEQRTGFLLPQEEHYFVQYNTESNNVRPTAQLIIDEAQWQRIERPEKLPALSFAITNIKTGLVPIKGEKETTAGYSTRVTAEIENKSFYNFWTVKFIVALYRQDEPVAVSDISLEKFLIQEKREMAISFKEAYPGISKVAIVPEVNVLDPEALFESESTGPAPLL